MKNLKLSVLLVILCSSTVFTNITNAQRVIVFDSTDSTKTEYRVAEDKNMVAWNLASLGRGAFTWDYERKLNNYVSVLGGAGITVFDPYSLMFAATDFDNRFQVNNLKFGYLLEVSVKLFPIGMDGFEGLYFAPIYRLRNYNYKLEENNTYYDASKYRNDICFNVGYRNDYNSIILDSFFGVGYCLGKVDVTRNFAGYDKRNIIITWGISIGFSF